MQHEARKLDGGADLESFRSSYHDGLEKLMFLNLERSTAAAAGAEKAPVAE